MGFCYYNNAAVAARYAQRVLGLGRVAIVDWDFHHGNGTEAVFYADPTVLYVSTHQEGAWPGTGSLDDRGAKDGRGANLNLPLPPGSGDRTYHEAFEQVIGPALAGFRPDLVLVSAGYDAHWRDPVGGMGLSVAGFAALTRLVDRWAQELCGGRIAVLLEGGYDLVAMPAGVLATVRALRGEACEDPLGPAPGPEPEAAALERLREARKLLR